MATFVQFFLGVSIISYLVDFTEFSRFKSTLPGYTIGGGLLVSALRIPLIAQTAIPFIILFSAIATLMALNRRYELVVARSAGVSAWQFLAPLCLASMLIGIAGRHRLQSAGRARAVMGAAARGLVLGQGAEQFRRAHSRGCGSATRTA